ncbi:hypothetical protein [Tunturiibacter lichenicola]|uniref:hypothetical protein n=1 Tax=Tunturiibacter lichenicola TaxID=2051959 RepID=UPI0021B1AC43|nr:hypothetical protein [Edaphobacter lichenicola]
MKFLRFLQLALFLAFFPVLAFPVFGQYRVGISGSIPIDKLESMDSALVVADPAQRLDLLKRLGIDTDVAEAATSPSFSHDIEIQPLHTQSGKLYGIVSLPCGTNWASLYLLEEAGTNAWHTVDHVALDCFHGTPTYRLISFAPGENAIFVEHANSGHGSGEVEDKATIYTIVNGRMHEVLSTIDYRCTWGLTDGSPAVEESSSFLQISSRVIEETRITSQDGVPLRAERRIWRWQATQAAFKATPFSTVPK